ncbi:hypothetical protein J6590_000851 [Homalodisca vitripennis]|nr:hypothetical protein J6590_000851 [Homalodisca vitripennis]
MYSHEVLYVLVRTYPLYTLSQSLGLSYLTIPALHNKLKGSAEEHRQYDNCGKATCHGADTARRSDIEHVPEDREQALFCTIRSPTRKPVKLSLNCGKTEVLYKTEPAAEVQSGVAARPSQDLREQEDAVVVVSGGGAAGGVWGGRRRRSQLGIGGGCGQQPPRSWDSGF